MKIWITILLLISAFFVQAQSYSSRKMEELGSEIPKVCLPPSDNIFICPKVLKSKPLVVNYNNKQEIEHLGISLFSNETKELINLPVCNFIERIILELVLEKTKEQTIQKLKRYKLYLKKNDFEYGTSNFISISSVLDAIQNPTRFSLRKDAETFTAIWEYNLGDQLLLSFPASRNLIFGTDKKESDELLNNSLFGGNNYCREENNISNEKISEEDLSLDSDRKIFTKKGNEFLLTFINANTYYEKAENTFELIFSKDYPEESLSNLIIRNTGELNHRLHITHRMYGHFSPDFNISLKEFLCFFQNDHDVFTAVSSFDSTELKLTIVIHSKNYNYIHLLLIRTSIENIFQNDGVLFADFYSNIPQENIKNLFADEIKKHKK